MFKLIMMGIKIKNNYCFTFRNFVYGSTGKIKQFNKQYDIITELSRMI